MNCTLKCWWRPWFCHLLSAEWLCPFMGLQGVTTTTCPTVYVAGITGVMWGCTEQRRAVMTGTDQSPNAEQHGTCFFTARVDDTPPPPPHFCLLSFASSLLPPLTTRDGTPSLYLTPNCGWSDLRWADTEWRLDKGNHPDSPGWSGRWLAAALLLSWGPGAAGPRGID